MPILAYRLIIGLERGALIASLSADNNIASNFWVDLLEWLNIGELRIRLLLSLRSNLQLHPACAEVR
jgi:hypothetical protein